MSRIGLIIEREYLETVGKKSFIITTLLVPILSIFVCGVLPAMLSDVKSEEKKVVAIVDETSAQHIRNHIQDTDEFIFQLVQNLDNGTSLFQYYTDHPELYAVVHIPADIMDTQKFNVYSTQSVNMGLEHTIRDVLRPELVKDKIALYDIRGLEDIIKDCDVNLKANTVKWDTKGSETISSADISMLLGMLLAVLTYMFVLIYGAMIMNGVVEEKANRIVEVIVSTVKPIELMFGKIIGVALVGFTQLAIWGILMGILAAVFGSMLTPDINATGADAMPDQEIVNGAMSTIMQALGGIDFGMIAVCFVLYFIGGYLLYASIFAAFGSAVDQQSDTSQFYGPIMMIMIFALYAGMFSIENPDGPLAWWCSMVPFTSPIVMMVRLPFNVPAYEVILSIVMLYATAGLLVWLAARIYRVGILMYGKKFSFKDILKWLK